MVRQRGHHLVPMFMANPEILFMLVMPPAPSRRDETIPHPNRSWGSSVPARKPSSSVESASIYVRSVRSLNRQSPIMLSSPFSGLHQGLISEGRWCMIRAKGKKRE